MNSFLRSDNAIVAGLAALQIVKFLTSYLITKYELIIHNKLYEYSLLLLVSLLLEGFYSKVLQYVSRTRAEKYRKTVLEKYDKLDQTSREKDTVHSFNNKLSRAAQATIVQYTWGINSLTNMLSTLVGVMTIMIEKQQVKILIVFIVMNIVWWFLVVEKVNADLRVSRKTMRKFRTNNSDQINLLMSRFQNRECDYNNILVKTKELQDEENLMDNKWELLIRAQQVPNVMIFFLIPWFFEQNQFVMALLLFNNMKGAFLQTSRFFSQFEGLQNDVHTVEEFFNGKTEKIKPTQVSIPDTLIFDGSVNGIINVNDLIEIKKGDRIRINGLTGCGKSTLIKGLIGHLEGIHYDGDYDPGSFIDKIAYMRQDIRDTTPTITTTVRQLFSDDSDDELIIRCLEDTCAVQWLNKTMEGDLDTPINNKISGGEKTRLCLATVLYQMRVKNAQWLILDEPEQGIDPELAPKMLHTVFDSCKDVTIFIITHLCECRTKDLMVNKVWTIENGVVNKN